MATPLSICRFDLETKLIKDLMPFPMAGVSYDISGNSYVIAIMAIPTPQMRSFTS